MPFTPGDRVILVQSTTNAVELRTCKPQFHNDNARGTVVPLPNLIPEGSDPEPFMKLLTAVHWDDDIGCGVPHPEEGLSFTLIRSQLLRRLPQTLGELLNSTPSSLTKPEKPTSETDLLEL